MKCRRPVILSSYNDECTKNLIKQFIPVIFNNYFIIMLILEGGM